jgi:hypothetical protein
LVERFGNVGLAAAAYNAGSQRVSNWLARRGKLPAETRHYVRSITGRPAEKWVRVAARADVKLPPHAQCPSLPIATASAPLRTKVVARARVRLAAVLHPKPVVVKVAASKHAAPVARHTVRLAAIR